jgi:hypothetical protein
MNVSPSSVVATGRVNRPHNGYPDHESMLTAPLD